MATVQQWGRKESIIWPPRGYVYTLGAFILACILAGLFIYIRFEYGLAPLQHYYLPYYLRTETAGLTHPVSQYQLLYVSDGAKPGRAALDSDVQPGSTPQVGGKPLPLMLTPDAAKHGSFHLTRESLRNYQNKALHAWIARWIYQDVPIYSLFRMQLVFGFVAFALQLPFSIPKDIRRIKELRYGRRLKGPVLVNGKQFTKAVAGNGIGITTNDSKLPLRIPRDAENKHFLIVGDTGSGKSSIIRQMLYQVESRGDSAIVYDPACEFVKQFYNPHRGDIVLNPLDARMSAGQAQTYHQKEFTAREQNYWSQRGLIAGEWQGRLVAQFGLAVAVSAEEFGKLSQGQHPETGEQLVRQRASYEYQDAHGRTIKTMEHRAGWDATFSAPKSVSLTALVGGDDRVREAHRENVSTALEQLEYYTQARIGGNHAPETTGKFIAAKFEHDTARPVDGYVAPQLHTCHGNHGFALGLLATSRSQM